MKICDPAVGSSHFLVSALNELIFIKAELRILVDERGDLLTNDFFFEVRNDELAITNLQTMRAFQYVLSTAFTDSQRVQEAIFCEVLEFLSKKSLALSLLITVSSPASDDFLGTCS